MIFKDTIYFWAFFILPVMTAIIIFGIRRRKIFLSALGEEKVIKRAAQRVSSTKRFWKNFILITSIGFLVIAMARPQMGVEKIHVKRKGVDVLFLLDTSLSMSAQDLKPDRLTRAKMWASTLIDNLKTARVGIIAFAGKPFLQCPLTTDYSACKMLLDIINVGTIPVQGTAIADAINLAVNSFPSKKGFFKAIILVTDGEDHEGNIDEATENAAKNGIKIITVGIGSGSGEPIPIRDNEGNITGYKKNKEGKLVMSKLESSTLESIASKTGGAFFTATSANFEISRVIRILNKMEKEEFGEEWLDRYEERFEYPLTLAIVLLLLEFYLTDNVLRVKKRSLGAKFGKRK